MKGGPSVTFGYRGKSLEDWRAGGCLYVEFWCLACNHMERVHIERLIGKVGSALPFVELARRAKCNGCGRRGCHVQPADPPKPEHRDYTLWLLAEMDRCREFLRWAEDASRGDE